MVSLIAGASVAGAYNWASQIYTYNRDAWMTDMQLDQDRAYQLDNLRIAMKNMDREEIRDLMQSDIGRINNVIIVTTLILSLAGEMLFEGHIPDDCAAFVLNAYMLCLGSAILHLVLSILFGMYASNEAYAISTQMLTSEIRPRWQAHFDKMKRRQGQEFTKAFDQKSMKAIFMPPMAARLAKGLKGTAGQSAAEPSFHENADPLDEAHGSSHFKAELDADAQHLADEPSGGYREAWEELGKDNWQHFKTYCFTCTAYGTKNLLEACGYLCIARLYGNNRDAWAFWAIQAIFVTLNVVMMQFLLGTGRNLGKSLIVAGAPLSCAIAATTSFELVDRICIPFCYFCHVAFTFFLIMNPVMEQKKDEVEDASGANLETQETTYFFNAANNCCDCSEQELATLPRETSSSSVALTHESSPHTKTAVQRQVSEGTRKRRRVAVRIIPQLMLRRGLSVVGVLWLSALGWALYGSIFGMDFKNEMAMMPDFHSIPEVADLTQVPVVFPSPYFKPHALVCPRKSIFLADSYRVFQLNDKGVVEPYPCDINGTILDLGASCNEDACWPLVLLATDPPAVLDCQTGQQRTLLQTREGLKRFSAPVDEEAGTLYAVRHGEVVQYQWQSHRSGWAPVWDIAKVDGELQAIDVVRDRLLLFNADGTVTAQNLKTGASCGIWTMPPTLMGAGCGVHGSESILILVRNTQTHTGAQVGVHAAVSVMEAQLPGAAASCGMSGPGPDVNVRLSSLRGTSRNESRTVRSLRA